MDDQPTFAGDEAPILNQKLDDYRQLQKQIDKVKQSMKAEHDYYQGYIDKYTEKQDEIKAEMQHLIESVPGRTSMASSQGNIHLMTKKDKWDWPTRKSDLIKVLKSLPKEFTSTEIVIDKKAIKAGTQITPNGDVVDMTTGEVLRGIKGQAGGSKSVSIRLSKEG